MQTLCIPVPLKVQKQDLAIVLLEFDILIISLFISFYVLNNCY